MIDTTTAELSVTIKYPEEKRYEGAPWVVFKGTVVQVRELIIEAYGFDRETVKDNTLHELTLQAQAAAKGAGLVASQLGGTVISQPSAGANTVDAWDRLDGKGGGVQAAASTEPAKPDHSGLIGLLNNAATVEDLKRLWTQNKPAFEDADVAAAYNARGKALSQAKAAA